MIAGDQNVNAGFLFVCKIQNNINIFEFILNKETRITPR